jgi:ribosomal protein L32
MPESTMEIAERVMHMLNERWYLLHSHELPQCPECGQYLMNNKMCQCKISEVML